MKYATCEEGFEINWYKQDMSLAMTFVPFLYPVLESERRMTDSWICERHSGACRVFFWYSSSYSL
jgi:hypothetical protein